MPKRDNDAEDLQEQSLAILDTTDSSMSPQSEKENQEFQHNVEISQQTNLLQNIDPNR